MRSVILVALSVLGCDRDSPRPPAPTTSAECTRRHGEKLGTPFVRICPQDLPSIIDAPFWIAAAPIACGGGAHETIPCPPIIALGGTEEARTAQLVDVAVAHRTCSLRFGGRLPTATERAQARDALSLATLSAVETQGGLRFQELPEWTTQTPCTTPSTIGPECGAVRSPIGASTYLDGSLHTCRVRAAEPGDRMTIRPDDVCPRASACDLQLRPTARRFAIDCAGTVPATAEDNDFTRAAFRCVVPESVLVGAITD